MNIGEFVDRIEDAYGTYRPSMKSIVMNNLSGTGWEDLEKLFQIVGREHVLSSAPAWGVISKCARENGIVLGSGGEKVYKSKCEFCDSLFGLYELECPKCKKKRKFGLIVEDSGMAH